MDCSASSVAPAATSMTFSGVRPVFRASTVPRRWVRRAPRSAPETPPIPPALGVSFFGGPPALALYSPPGVLLVGTAGPSSESERLPRPGRGKRGRHLRDAGAADSEILAADGDAEQVGRAEQLVKD